MFRRHDHPIRSHWSICSILVLFLAANVCFSVEQDYPALRSVAQKLQKDGNFKEAYEKYRRLALAADNDERVVGRDFNHAIECLQRLNRIKQTDALREAAVDAHPKNWRLLQHVANSYLNAHKYGAIVAGEFERGPHRGGARYVNTFQRDRARALQLMHHALQVSEDVAQKAELAQFYLSFARAMLYSRGQFDSWRLQVLTNWDELPDYSETHYYRRPRNYGAPVDEEGRPVLHHVPRSFDEAKTDGERWRWLMVQAVELNPALETSVKTRFADFLYQQFGVQTMQHSGYPWGRQSDDDGDQDESGPYAVHTLGDGEFISRTAIGIRRFELPNEFNFIRIYRDLVKQGKSSFAADRLAQIFENRRQFTKASAAWKDSIERFGPGSNQYRRHRLEQIGEPWGRFEPVMSQAAGKGATVDYRFRNGRGVSFTARAIKIERLLEDVKNHLRSNPAKLDWNRINIGNIGYRIVAQNEKKYVGNKVAQWELDLKPRRGHNDRRVTVTTPLQKAGAYLLTAQMEDGNVSRIIIWLNDTVILKKPLNNQTWFYVGDARTGEPIEKANLSFFGYQRKHLNKKIRVGRRYDVLTSEFAEFTGKDGQVIPARDDLLTGYQWIITARTEEGRMAYLGFSGVWYGRHHDYEYNQTKPFTITDRPVYRPDQTVHFKIWLRHAKYDQEDVSAYANGSFEVHIRDPKSQEVFKQSYTADAYGGIVGEYVLPPDAALGQYYIYMPGYNGIHFRVEEYKKPEFEVTVDAPDRPVALGDVIKARVNAKYYFGAPVTEATVKYKVHRYAHDSRWFPTGYWDWFYGPGYWWFAYDYAWYPRWAEWGCLAPVRWWWPQQPSPPELVLENEVEIGEDGSVEINIDSAVAKAVHGDLDHRYEITAEVVDQSRRTIVGKGSVLVARRPFKVYAWVDRGHYRVGDTVQASFSAQTLDNKPVQGKGKAVLYRISYNQYSKRRAPTETRVRGWVLDTDAEGKAALQVKASRAGQYRIALKVTDAAGHMIEGGYLFNVRGEGFDGAGYRFNHIELISDRREYEPGDKAELMINTDRAGATVLLFVRPSNSVYLAPKLLRLKGKSTVEQIEVSKKDMPNFFVEAITISDGRVHTDTREIIVPPEKRVLNVEIEPSAQEYKPGEKATVTVSVTDFLGKPLSGSLVMSIYDKAVEYISGGSNIPEIRETFWKWRRHHRAATESNLQRMFVQLIKSGDKVMGNLGVFGDMITIGGGSKRKKDGDGDRNRNSLRGTASDELFAANSIAPAAPEGLVAREAGHPEGEEARNEDAGAGGAPDLVTPTVRSAFADTALWEGALDFGEDGKAEVKLTMPENLSGWKVRAWALTHGTKVGEGTVEVVTTKNLLLRMQAPRFFVETDEVVLSANIHNYLASRKSVQVELEFDGPALEIAGDAKQTVTVDANGEQRVDWRVRVVKEGEAVIRMFARTDEESDAMEMRFPVYVHGMLKTESFSAAIRPDGEKAVIEIDVPAERRIAESRLEIRYSPSLAMAMVDALPYMVDYPYGCTEQTLNRFLPTVLTQKILMEMGLDLDAIREKRSNLNAQEVGDDRDRAAQWKRFDRNPVFDHAIVTDMVKKGVKRLTAMQLSDGGWGWFSGWGEQSYPHTTAVVVHGLQIALQNDVAIVPGVMQRGVAWLERYQQEQVRRLKNGRLKKPEKPWKSHADNMDAFVYMVLIDADKHNADMLEFLYEDRNYLSVYAKAMYGIALHAQQEAEKLAMIMRNIGQFVVQDDENQTAYLDMPNRGYWWYWYGSEYEAHAYYLKLLSRVDPKGDTASRIVKYLLNNRKNATYWRSTRDTALCIEAFADYIRASDEAEPDITVEILVDGRRHKEVRITADNLFTYDNKLVLFGDAVETGKHSIEIRRKGTGPLYVNAYLANFTLEEYIRRAGLEIKVNRAFYRLEPVEKTIKAAGSRGQAVDQRVEKYKRIPIENLAVLKSGDLVEIELEIESKNDYEYIVFEDMKAAGFEPVEMRSGYTQGGIRAYMELRDERVVFFMRTLARGRHSVSYRMRAEIPGRFSALPTRAYAMYAPELKANSDEIKLRIED